MNGKFAVLPALVAGLLAGAGAAQAQLSASELVVRLERIENHLRQLTGTLEELQYRNQQLEQQVRQLQGAPPDAGQRPQARPGPAPGQIAPGPMPAPPAVPGRRSDLEPGALAGPSASPVQPAAAPPGRRADVFDPAANPTAPGVPRPLGSPQSAAPPPVAEVETDEDAVGAPGGRAAGAPLDLSTLSSRAASDPALAPPAAGQALPPPPPRNPNATGAVAAVAPPSATPKDAYDLAYGYVLRKDYALAEDAFRDFVKKYPGDARVAEAHYWLGETLFQRQRYRDAAESFLSVSTKFESAPRAPEALLRLGQSLAALKEKEAACATFGEVGRKYPRASANVKATVQREQKRVGC
ncbi:MAG: tol-pal system protein YbgF [Xanthobacteraceae bacterium]|nr:tol-pal system protein YbgF [Xanthobacteraceae bacterium]